MHVTREGQLYGVGMVREVGCSCLKQEITGQGSEVGCLRVWKIQGVEV